MTTDAYVQVALDSTGKKVAMDQGTDAAGNTVYFQKALLIAQPADDLNDIRETNKQILLTLQAIFSLLSATTNVRVEVDDFETPN